MKNGLLSYLKENTIHGTKEFPVGFYQSETPRHFQDMLIHWHEEMEFTKVRRGTLRYDIDQIPYEISEGDILLIGPDILHAAHQIQEHKAETNTVVFHLQQAGLETQDASTQRYVLPLREGKLRIPPVVHPGDAYYAELDACFEAMWACQEPEYPYRELRFKAKVYELLQLVWQHAAGKVAEPPTRILRQYEGKLKLALAYMQEHYTEPITIQCLADLAGFSQVHFMNIFKAALGCTCIAYLVNFRLAHAALDLQETDHSIMQIALDNGFQNTSYFNRAFKEHYGMTPSAYRKGLKGR